MNTDAVGTSLTADGGDEVLVGIGEQLLDLQGRLDECFDNLADLGYDIRGRN